MNTIERIRSIFSRERQPSNVRGIVADAVAPFTEPGPGPEFSRKKDTDCRYTHLQNVRSIQNRAKVLEAVEFLRGRYDGDPIRPTMVADPEWWVSHHFSGMMGVRNELRKNGFGERELGLDNLDDYAVGLLELAMGVTAL